MSSIDGTETVYFRSDIFKEKTLNFLRKRFEILAFSFTKSMRYTTQTYIVLYLVRSRLCVPKANWKQNTVKRISKRTASEHRANVHKDFIKIKVYLPRKKFKLSQKRHDLITLESLGTASVRIIFHRLPFTWNTSCTSIDRHEKSTLRHWNLRRFWW